MTPILAALVVAISAPVHGQLAYTQHCASCHGADLRGTVDGPSLRGVGPAAVDFMLQTGRMPAAAPGIELGHHMPLLPPGTIADIEAYIDSVAPGGPPIPEVVIGDARHGHTLFAQNCQHCHGVDASGAAIGGSAWAPSLHDTSITQVAEAVRIGPDEMPPFSQRQLSAADVDDIGAYVFQLDRQAQTFHVPAATTGPVPEGLVGWLAVAVLAALALVFSREARPKR